MVNPSPQHLSRGNEALSTTRTEAPARAAVTAAAEPAGPPPTIARSTSIRSSEEFQLVGLDSSQVVVVHDHAADAPVLGEDPGLRSDLLGHEHPSDWTQ
ncbi:MAG: hypothetical protein Ct9H300mP31_14750 [Acidimicrobiaceae bacterium]|nr:MAG: hypothetical protein Ct9H300mP31_14750 [Acidimicrobiaceae bacterium]